MAALGPYTNLENYADEDREPGIDSDWGPGRNVYAWTTGRKQWRLRQKKKKEEEYELMGNLSLFNQR